MASCSMERPRLRFVFKYINKFFMVPAFRLGLGSLIVNPVAGYIMVLKTTGKKSGKVRYAPVNYAIIDGSVYCVPGWGRGSHWFSNLKANPNVELQMPGGAMIGLAEEVTNAEEARRAVVEVARNAGFATFFNGLNPLTATDEEVLTKVGELPVVRIHPTGFCRGPNDPGGWGWVLPMLIVLFWMISRRRVRR